jgi:hypothetical protein
MSQLHFYVSEQIEARIRARAEQAHMPLSRYLAELVKREVADEWPDGYAETVIGKWQGEPLKREPEGDYEQRPKL